MLDLLTIEEDKAAAEQGWGLYHVYDEKADQWVVRILPADAAEKVVAMARTSAPLALRALTILSNSKGARKWNTQKS